MRVNEILREIYWEALRAPSINTTILRNPYRREFLKKKFLGRMKAERIETKETWKKQQEEKRRKVDEDEVLNKKEEDKKSEGLR